MQNLQAEYLKELMNIAIGNATASIAEILDAFGTMYIPEVAMFTSSEFKQGLKNYIKEREFYYTTRQLFSGEFNGEALFILTDSSASNLVSHLYSSSEISQEEKIDAIMEMANILNATIIGRLSEELQTEVQFSAPSTKYVRDEQIIEDDELMNYSKIIAIQTVITFKDQDIYSKILILTKDKAINKLLELIDRKLEDLFS